MYFRDGANNRSNVIPIRNTKTWESGGLTPAMAISLRLHRWEKIFANEATDKRLISKLYKQFL